jgi:hypothetical protein
MGLGLRTNHNILWFERVRASVAKEAMRCNGHLILLIFGHLTLSVPVRELSSTCVETPFRGDVIRPLAPPLGVGLG